jgi:hypothetical protein
MFPCQKNAVNVNCRAQSRSRPVAPPPQGISLNPILSDATERACAPTVDILGRLPSWNIPALNDLESFK